MRKLLILVSLIIFNCISMEDPFKETRKKAVKLQGPGILTLKTEKNITAMAKLICVTCHYDHINGKRTAKDYNQGMGSGNGLNYLIMLKHDHEYLLQIEKNNEIYLEIEEINKYFENGNFNFVSDKKILNSEDQPFNFQQNTQSRCILY